MPKPLLDERTNALLSLGYFQWADAVFMLILVMHVLTAVFWSIFGAPTLLQLLFVVATALLILAVWIVLLIFRCCWFVLQLTADIKTMPTQAAKLALSFASGRGSTGA